MRLIDADELIAALEYEAECYERVKEKETAHIVRIAKNVVSHRETVSPPDTVRHGKWIRIKNEYQDFTDTPYYQCSLCKAEEAIDPEFGNRVNYCWSCGAKMDMEESGDV